MNLNLERKYRKDMADKGDILVFENTHSRKKMYYLIIKDAHECNYLLLKLEGNELITSVESKNPNTIVKKARERFNKLDFMGIIKADEFELTRIYN
ncbi:TPA: hypothetical protein ACORDH_002800 [Bacillus cereus]|uniref:hypothetical protein n=1 Tax=Bacillus sp. ISTL8 TaxID=2596896 RepID=UPI001456C5E8|nr:hypothetical protein [Bacillus sp. ISTL8]